MKTTNPDLFVARPILMLALIGVLASIANPLTAQAQSQANGTTVFRCIDINGVVNFADAPCNQSASQRIRIEHSLIQSAPISMAEQQRLHALEQRLSHRQKQSQRAATIEQKRKRLEAQAVTDRCLVAQSGLDQIRRRKRAGYPLAQAKRIDREERSLEQELRRHCRN